MILSAHCAVETNNWTASRGFTAEVVDEAAFGPPGEMRREQL